MTRHPNTLWDQEDIDHYKEMLKTSRELRSQFLTLKGRIDERILRPLDIPPPQRRADGGWLYPGDYFPPFPGAPAEDDPVTRFRRYLSRDGEAISDLGTVYALTGDEKYAKYARELLLAYSNCSRYGSPKSLDYRRNLGLAGMFLNDAIILQKIARGYDIVYSSPVFSAQDHNQIHDELLLPLASEMLYPSIPDIEFDRKLRTSGQQPRRHWFGSRALGGLCNRRSGTRQCRSLRHSNQLDEI